MAMITIDGKEYDTEALSDEAKSQLAMIQFVDAKLASLQGEIAVMQTARNAYSKELSEMLASYKAQ